MTTTADFGPRVGLFGLLGSGNIGNDGSLDAVLAYLRTAHPDAVLDAICDGPAEVTRRFGMPATRLHWNRREYETAAGLPAIARKALGKVVDAFRIAAWVRRHDAVIMPGMGAFEATLPLRPWGTPYSLFLLCTFGRWFGTRVALVSVGANVVRNPATRRLFVAAARRAHYLSFRDEYSRDAMREMGLAERGDPVYPDLVFSLPTPAVPGTRTGAVGVGVLDYHGGDDDRARADELHDRYVGSMCRFVRWLLDGGRDVRLLTGDRVDETVVQEILADLRESRPDLEPGQVQADPVDSLHELMTQMVGLDVVVATRYHNVVCALKMAKPTISIGYAVKNDIVMAEMGLEEYCQRAGSVDVDRLISQFTELESRRAELTATMAATLAANRARLDEQFVELSASLLPGSTARRPGVPTPAA
ncbi:polysaccharide pyruvyl transferase family protein [Pseudonocardia sp.]|uniref:polysaccharide pyruvyl transferase family protein n=1 Tax=Pseudonocardia sp. TaxID=60912 RepID=UPI002609A467|nr:polysaccharide pyruvyl transferase family protein [Pseudonocardia sp.]